MGKDYLDVADDLNVAKKVVLFRSVASCEGITDGLEVEFLRNLE
jgi:hypothetical protein